MAMEWFYILKRIIGSRFRGQIYSKLSRNCFTADLFLNSDLLTKMIILI